MHKARYLLLLLLVGSLTAYAVPRYDAENPFPAETIDEDNQLVVNDVLTHFYNDEEGGLVAYQNATANQPGFSLSYDQAEDQLTITPPADWNTVEDNGSNPVVITIVATDNPPVRATASGAFLLTISAVNDAPELNLAFDAITTDEDTPFTLDEADLLDHFVDQEDDNLEITALSFNQGTAVLDGGIWTVTPGQDYFGAGTVSLTVAESETAEQYTVDATISVTVTAVNDSPVVATPLPDANSDEDTDFVIESLLANFSDVEQATLGFTGVSFDVVGFTDDWDGSALTITPPADWNSIEDNAGDPVVVTIAVSDGVGGSVQEVFELTIDPVNDMPVYDGELADLTIDEDTNTDIVDAILLDEFYDEDGDELIVSDVSMPNGTVQALRDIGTGWRLTPDPDFFGDITVTVTVQEAGTAEEYTAEGTFTLTVDPINDAPVLTTPFNAMDPDEDENFTVFDITDHFTDVDGDELYVSLAEADDPALHLTIFSDNVLVEPDPDTYGDYQLTLTVSDGSLTAQGTVDVTILPINDAPFTDVQFDAVNGTEDVVFVIENVIGDHFDDVDNPQDLILSNITADVDGFGYDYDEVDDDLSVTPPANYNGDAVLTLTIDDQALRLTTQATIDVTLASVNDEPTIAAPIADRTINEDASFTVNNVLDYFDDVDLNDAEPDELSIEEVVVLAGDGSVVVGENSFTVTPGAHFNGTMTIGVAVTDLHAAVEGQTFDVTVTPVNDAPFLSGVLADQDVNEDATLNLLEADLLAAFDDVDLMDVGSTEELVLVNINGSHMTRVDNGDNWDLTPEEDYNGDITVTVTVADEAEVQTTGTFTLTVNYVEDLPILSTAFDDESIDEDTEYSISLAEILGHFDDEDLPYGDELTVDDVVLSNGDWSVVLADPVEITPGNNVVSSTNVQIFVLDDADNVVSDEFTISINPLNDCLVMDGPGYDDRSINEDASWNVNATTYVANNYSDIDGDDLSLQAIALDDGNAVNNGDGTWTVTPDANFHGTITVTMTVTDGTCTLDDMWTLTVNSINDNPTFTGSFADVTTDEDVAFTVVNPTAQFSDVDVEDGLSVETWTATLLGMPVPGFTFTPSGDDFLVGLPADYNTDGTDDVLITMTVTDGTADVSTSFDLTINAVNDCPRENEANPLNDLVTDEDTPISFSNAAVLSHFMDVEGDAMYVESVEIEGGSTDFDGNTWTVTPPPEFNGVIPIVYRVNDFSCSDEVEQNLVVTSIADCPVYDGDLAVQSTDEDTPLDIAEATLVAEFSDPDEDELTVYLANSVWNHGTISVVEGTVTFTPDEDYNGTSQVTLAVTDGLCPVTGTFDLTVNSVNDAPVLNVATVPITTDEDTPFDLTSAELIAQYTDVDGDDLAINDLSFDQGSFVLEAGTYTFTPDQDYNGAASIFVEVVEVGTADLYTADNTIAVTVNPVNDAPVLDTAFEDAATDEEVAYTVLAVAGHFSDVDLDELEVVDVDFDPDNASFDIEGADVVIDPDVDFVGDIEVTLTISDGNGGSADGVFTLTVNPINDAPELVLPYDPVNSDEDETFVIVDLLDGHWTDVDMDALSVSFSDNLPTRDFTFNYDVEEDELSVIPPQDFNGNAVLTVTVDDRQLRVTSSANINVSIAPVNDLPVLVTPFPDNLTEVEDEDYAAVGSYILDRYTDVDGDELGIISIDFEPGDADFDGDETYYFHPEPNYNGVIEVLYVVTDGNPGGLVAGSYDVTYAFVNDAPTLVGGIADQDIAEDGQVVISQAEILAQFDDVDLPYEDELSILDIEMTNGSVAPVNGDAVFTVDPDYTGTCTVDIIVQDLAGATATDQFIFTINPENNDAPELVTPFDPESVVEGATWYISIADVLSHFDDIDGDVLDLADVNFDNGVVLVEEGDGPRVANTHIEVTPVDENFVGTTTLTFVAADGEPLTAEGSIELSWTAVDDDPILITPFDLVLGNEDEDFVIAEITSHYNEVDGEDLVVSDPAASLEGFSFDLDEDDLTVTPPANWFGDVEISFTINDVATRAAVQGSVNVTLLPVNDPPTLVEGHWTELPMDEDGTVILLEDDILAQFEDVESDELEVMGILFPNGNVVEGVDDWTLILDANWDENFSMRIDVWETATGEQYEASLDLTVVVTPVNDAPVLDLAFDDVTIDEDEVFTIFEITTHFSDIDSEDLTVSNYSADVEGYGFVLDGDDLTVTPPQDSVDPAVLSLTVSDGELSAQTTLNITINPVNDAPVQVVDVEELNYDEEDSFSINNVPAYFDDVDGDPINLLGATLVDGSVELNGNNVNFTLDDDFFGITTGTLTVTDGDLTATANFSVNVTNINDAPELDTAFDNVTTPEDVAFVVEGITSYFNDVDMDELTVSDYGDDLGDLCTFELVGDDLTVTPPADWNSIAQGMNIEIDLTVSDGNGGSASTSFVVTVTPVNDCPVRDVDILDFAMAEGTTFTLNDVLDNFSDADGDDLDFQEITFTCGTALQVGADIELTPEPDFFGTCDLDIVVTDGFCNAVESVVVTVTNQADCPVFETAFDAVTVDEDTPFTGSVSEALTHFTDPDGDELTLVDVDFDLGMTVIEGDLITFTPDEDVNGLGEVAFTVSDGMCQVTGTMEVNLTPINDAPKFTGVLVERNYLEDDVDDLIIDILDRFTDPEGDTKIFDTAAIVSDSVATFFDLNIDGDNVAFAVNVAGEDYNGVFEISATVSDDQGATSTETIAVLTVIPVNDCPVYLADVEPLEADEEETFYMVDPLSHFLDVDGDVLELTSVLLSCGTATIMGDSIECVPAEDFSGACSLTLRVSDGNCEPVQANIAVTINALNDAPELVTPFADVEVDEETSFTILNIREHFEDPEDDNLIVSAYVSDPEGFGFVYDELGDDLSVTPTMDFFGEATVTVTISDRATRATTDAVINVTVNNVNDCPTQVVSFEEVEALEETPFNVIEVFSHFEDVDGAAELQILEAWFDCGTTEIGEDMVTFTPEENQTGMCNASITIWDGTEGCEVVAPFTVDIGGTNDAPVIVMDVEPQTVAEDNSFSLGDVLSHFDDPDGDTIYVTQTTADVDGFTVEYSEAEDLLTVIPAADYNGTATIEITVSDVAPERASVTLDFDLVVTPINDEPVLIAAIDPLTSFEDQPLVIADVTAWFEDVDEDVLEISASTLMPEGAGVLEIDGVSATYTPTQDFTGDVELSFTVSDGEYTATTGTIDLSVIPVNDPPFVVAELDTLTLVNMTSDSSIDLSEIFDDPDGDVLNFSHDYAGADLSIDIDENGVVTIASVSEWIGETDIAFTADDGFELARFGVDLSGRSASRVNSEIVVPLRDTRDTISSTLHLIVEEPSTFFVSGVVSYFIESAPVEMVTMSITGDNELTMDTGADGSFEFELDPGDYILAGDRDEADLNGVSVTDIIKIRRHLAALETFDSPFKYLATDVNASGSVSVTDIIKIRRYLAGLEDLASGDWSLVPNEFEINNENWMLAPDALAFEPLMSDVSDADFTAVRMGDVNGSWAPPALQRGNGGNARMQLGDSRGLPGEEIVVPVSIDGAALLAGIELDLGWDADLLSYTGCDTDLVDPLINATDGRIRLVWDSIEQLCNTEQTTLNLRFRVTGELGDTVELDIARAVICDIEGTEIGLQTEDGRVLVTPANGNLGYESVQVQEFALYQNWPNPFNPTTTITFDVAESRVLLKLRCTTWLGRGYWTC